MAKTRPKTPAAAAAAAAAAAEKDEKASELPTAPPPPADPPCPYLLSFDVYRRIFGERHSVDEASISTDIDAPDAAAADTKPTTTADKLQLLQEALGVQHCAANPRTAAWVDFCFGVLCFARGDGESDASSARASHAADEKALLLLTIANDIFQFATSPTAAANNNSSESEALQATDLPSVQLCYDRFRDRVREVSSSASPNADSEQQDASTPAAAAPHERPRLSTPEVARFVAFLSATLFRHLPAYQFVFRHARASVTREVALLVETPFPPAPLALATQLPADE